MPDRLISFDVIPDAIVTSDRAGIIRQVNRRLADMFGYSENELIGARVEILLPEELRKDHVHHRDDFHRNPTIRPMGRGVGLRGRRKDGSEFPVDIMLSRLDDGRILAVVRDTTAATKMSEELRRLAYHDPLTGLPNRAALNRDLKELLGSRPNASNISLALFDLDGFNEINDTLGHSCGDRLLEEVARRWTSGSYPGTQIYRQGGDEFVLLVTGGGDLCRIALVVKAMLQALEKPFDIGGTTAFISASAGISLAPRDGADAEELMANVDLALYRAKAIGRGNYAFFHNTLRAEVQARRDLDTKLRQAFLEGEFELYFQPQVRLTDGTIVGAEALLRWNQDLTVVSPGAFIETLTASPIASSVGSWILRNACETAVSWQEMGFTLRTAVNLFPSQYHSPLFFAELQNLLAETGLPASALELEITENTSLHGHAATLEALRKLRDLGVAVAFDDFGTGYASLSFLTQMPLTHIKIDQNFVRGLPDDPKLSAIVRSMIVMAHNLGLRVIAEGVETLPQMNFLRAEGCDEAQGFLFARPLPATAFVALLESEFRKPRTVA